MSRGRTKEGWEGTRGCILAEGEFGRGETERERGGGKETKGEESSPLADYVPSPPRSFTPAMFFLPLPLSSATADDLAGLRRVHPPCFQTRPKPPSPTTNVAGARDSGTRLDRRQNVIGFWSATRRFRRLELRFLSPRPRPFGKRHTRTRFRERSRSPRSFFMILSDRPDSPDDEAQLTVRHYDFRVKLLKRKGKA